jgi:hypothetical protein
VAVVARAELCQIFAVPNGIGSRGRSHRPGERLGKPFHEQPERKRQLRLRQRVCRRHQASPRCGIKANDEGRCGDLAAEIAKKYKDPFTHYAVALRCVHMEPDRPGPRKSLVVSFVGVAEPNIVGSEMPDALEQGQLEAEVMYQIAARRLEHPEEWAPEESKITVVQGMALAKFFRGQHMRLLHRDQEARQYFLQSVKLDPAATPAQTVLNQMSN